MEITSCGSFFTACSAFFFTIEGDIYKILLIL